MPRDPIDISTHAAAKRARKIAELDDQKDPIRLRVGSGPAGATGAAGKDGATWYSGTTVPSTGLGVVGDFYFRTTTSDVYKKTGVSAWSLEANIKGAEGTPGTEGKEGPGGKEGPAGSTANNDWKNSVRAATTANITISTALNNGDTLDGLTLATNDRVLVKNQTTKTENGIWVVGVTPVRATDADEAAELSGGSTVYVEAGTRNSKRLFRITTVGNITPGTTAHDWAAVVPKDFGLVKALPTSEAVAGDLCSFIADETNGIIWRLTYDGEGEFPWKKIGGPPLLNEVVTQQSTASATYTNLTTVGPELKSPLKGDYNVSWGANAWNSTANCHARMGIEIGGVAPEIEVDNNQPTAGAFSAMNIMRKAKREKIAASTVFVAKYRQISGGEASFTARWLEIDPIRVG